MQDLVALGTGNSRLMKSNIPANTTLAQFIQMLNNGTFPYDIGPLNPAGISQEGTPLNKGTMLSDTTAALLGDVTTPDQALAKLSVLLKYNQYWWRRRVHISSPGYYEYREPTTSDIEILNARAQSSSTTDDLNYALDISVDLADGTISLIDERTITIKTQNGSSLINSSFRGHYVPTEDSLHNKLLLYIPTSASIVKTNESYWYTYTYTKGSVYEVTSRYEDRVEIGNWEYMYSNDRSAYPNSGIVEGYEYEYLGIPLDNAVEAGINNIITGTYVGAGKYGVNNPNIINCPFKPKMASIRRVNANTGTGILMDGSTKGWNGSNELTLTWDYGAFSWYGNSATNQLNEATVNYCYVIVG